LREGGLPSLNPISISTSEETAPLRTGEKKGSDDSRNYNRARYRYT